MITKQSQRLELDNLIMDYLLKNPTIGYVETAKLFGVSQSYISTLTKARNIKRPRGLASPAWKRKTQVV
jgi:hypothetical protein